MVTLTPPSTLRKEISQKVGSKSRIKKARQNESHLSNQFLNHLAHKFGHDLRSPMFVVKSYAQLLQKTQEKERLDRGFKMIVDATSIMERTISSLVELMDIYTVPVENFKNVYFQDVFEQVKIQLCNEIEIHKPTFIVDFNACDQVNFPTKFLKIILFNLIDNAIRHNPEKKDLEITISALKKNKRIILKVKDNGKGIACKKELKKLKEPFYSHTDDPICTGIGLSKVQAIAIVTNSEFEIKAHSSLLTKFTFPS